MRSSQKSSFGLLQFFWRDLFRTFYHQFYILSDQVWWCNTKQLSSYFKNYICKFMQAYSWHHKLFHLHLSFCIWKVWKGREKIQKFEYLENEKSFLDEIKNTFLSFWRAIIWSKNKNLIKKIAGTSFKKVNLHQLSLHQSKASDNKAKVHVFRMEIKGRLLKL